MNGIHDMGGRHGFGAIVSDPDEPLFRAPWEGRIRALASLLVGRGAFNVDAFRHAIERVPPSTYLTAGYFGRWLEGVELLVDELGSDLVAGRVDGTAGSERPERTAPRFSVGDAVKTRNLQPCGHTRLPAYVREKRGVVVLLQGTWVLPDTHAHDRGENPEPLYSVRFDGHELWGEAAEAGTAVHIDLFETYLEPL